MPASQSPPTFRFRQQLRYEHYIVAGMRFPFPLCAHIDMLNNSSQQVEYPHLQHKRGTPTKPAKGKTYKSRYPLIIAISSVFAVDLETIHNEVEGELLAKGREREEANYHQMDTNQ